MKTSPDSRIFNSSIEKPREKGIKVTVHDYWIRHTQKKSGDVFNAEKSGISLSNISPGGAERAESRGRTLKASLHGAKGFKSTSERTQESFDALMRGYAELNPDAPIREKVRIRQELMSPSGTPEFMKEYDEKWSANKKRILREGIAAGIYPDIEFSNLTPDQQEEIAEAAEEPVIREWIDKPESSMAKKFPPRIQAANFARLFDRHLRMANKLNFGSEVDLFNNTHKTATEPFLASGVLRRKEDGKQITSLDEIGGSLKILDQWESISQTDDLGKRTEIVLIRGKEYEVDQGILQQLIREAHEKVSQ